MLALAVGWTCVHHSTHTHTHVCVWNWVKVPAKLPHVTSTCATKMGRPGWVHPVVTAGRASIYSHLSGLVSVCLSCVARNTAAPTPNPGVKDSHSAGTAVAAVHSRCSQYFIARNTDSNSARFASYIAIKTIIPLGSASARPLWPRKDQPIISRFVRKFRVSGVHRVKVRECHSCRQDRLAVYTARKTRILRRSPMPLTPRYHSSRVEVGWYRTIIVRWRRKKLLYMVI